MFEKRNQQSDYGYCIYSSRSNSAVQRTAAAHHYYILRIIPNVKVNKNTIQSAISTTFFVY